ncbi:MAG: class I SAM-dependent methyltransferase [Bacteroidia bacterium]|nr:class I SAM-dependent methyltransferase [Bacteroidia bacterium]MCZ2277402.1 class I SAM-dependent methyltransferase [Bacteroidia bacterium]
MNQRIINELEHGKKLLAEGAESVWNWESAAGKVRADRRAGLLASYSNLKPGEPALEIGCGTGLFSNKFFKLTHADITATDLSQDLLNVARMKYHQIRFKVEDAMSLSFEDNRFQAVFGSSVLHHLDLKKAVTEIRRVLKPGGRMVFAEPNMLNPQIFIQKNIPFIKKWLGDSPDETAIIRWQFKKLLKETGFNNIHIFPYDFLHPATPPLMIGFINSIGKTIERIPGLREIAGSVIIYAEK